MLNGPAYTIPDDDIGFVTRVYPGLKENASIFSHPNPWAWAAECKLGRGDRAMEFYNALCPYYQNDKIEIRESEPYSYCQFVVGKSHTAFGRARHPFMTGTGGWRAVIGDEFTRANIQLLAKALAAKMENEGCEEEGICIGYDRRFLSKEAVMWACEVFAAQGIRCWFVNRSSPTPLIMYYVKAHCFPYGLMVTASHNPAIYNGIKLFTKGGRDADERQKAEVEAYIEREEEELKRGHEIPLIPYEEAREKGLVVEFNPINEYIDSIIDGIDMKVIRDQNLRVALDPMYGVSQTSLKTILSIARCEVETIHERHDTLFGGKLPAPNASTLRSLQNYVIDRKCHIGIATDGDADRIGVIDDQGRFLHPNDILVLLYYYLVKYKKWTGPAVRNVATTHMLDRVAESFGQVCYEVPVGFKYISAKMEETDALIGGESSGGLTVRGHISGKDGIYAATLLVEMAAVTGKSISGIIEDIRKEYGVLYMEERDYRFNARRKEEIQRLLLEEKRLPPLPWEIEKVSYLDGCKVYLKNGGWIIARFSGTEPLLRIFYEMKKEEEAIGLCELFEEFLDLEK